MKKKRRSFLNMKWLSRETLEYEWSLTVETQTKVSGMSLVQLFTVTILLWNYLEYQPASQRTSHSALHIIFYICYVVFICNVFYICYVATLGSILDSHLIWESGKFQLARWSHNVALFSSNHQSRHPPATHPPTRSPSFSNRSNDYWEPVLMCGVPRYWPPVQKVCAVPPPLPIGTLFLKYVRCPPLPVYTFSVRCPPPI